MSFMSAGGTGNYAAVTVASQRSDLSLYYERLSFEISQYTKDGADLMISNVWMEQPPTTKDNDQFTNKKDTMK
ncbi:DUF3231 family protein [Neobacillus sp. FSL H8-0543]|uniref:DUF3231 family protein n=1 Tax=Neobacillus sp. FSL H8-0543 TaxID=2954672 RepID=UPI003158AE47